MKRNIIISIIVMFAITINAQIKVNTSIRYVKNNLTTLVYLEITNNSNETLYIRNNGLVSDEGQVLEDASTFIEYTAYSLNYITIGSSEKRPIFVSPEEKGKLIKIEKNKSFVTIDRLFISPENRLQGIFSTTLRGNIKYLKAKLHLKCILQTMTGFQEIDVVSNTITL